MAVRTLIVVLCLLAVIPACSKSEPTPAAQTGDAPLIAVPVKEPEPIVAPVPVLAQEVANPDITPKEQPIQTVEGLFNELQARFAKIDDYQCVFDAFVAKDDQTDRRVYNYYFKKDKRIRMEVIKGKNTGANLVYNGKDVVVRPSGIIIDLFTFTFAPTDKKLCDLRGFTIPQSDWGTFIDGHIKYLGKCSSRITARDTSNGQEIITIEIESGRPEETMDIARENVWLDHKEKVLLKFEQYDKSGKLIRANSYMDIKINSGLKDELFSNP
jgi:outer membrane lipoprotein-sorting protein